MEEKTKLTQEIDYIKSTSNKNIQELGSFSSFFKIFITYFQEQINSLNDNILKYTEKHSPNIAQSLLSTNLNTILANLKQFNSNSKVLQQKIQTELIDSLDLFKKNQSTIYKSNNDELSDIYTQIKNNKNRLLYWRNIYYKSLYNSKKEENEQNKKIKNNIKINEEELDMLVKDKMETKNYEIIYKYEIERYNNELKNISNNYLSIKDKIEIAEKSRISFIKTSFDKYKKFWNNFSKIINEYTDSIDILFSSGICDKIQKENINEISIFSANTKQSILSLEEKFVPFNESEFDFEQKNKYKISQIKVDKNPPPLLKNEEKIQFYTKLINNLVGEDEVHSYEIAKLIEIFQYQKENEECEKDFIDVLVQKNKSSLKFLNLKNLELLSIPISYITLKYSSIFEGKFELNFNIIFLAERFLYQNKINNNKVYLSALLSKNKFYRTKLFWRNIIELKLVNKLNDHISRLKNVVLPGEKKKSIFSKLVGKSTNINTISRRNSFLSQSRIIYLIKDYDNLEENRIPMIDKMATQEMFTLLKTSIPNFSNFNFPSAPSLDLISQLCQEYKIPTEHINYFLIYYKVSNNTIRQLLPHEKSLNVNDNINSKDNLSINIKKRNVIIFSKVIPFLDYKDYNNFLHISKF